MKPAFKGFHVALERNNVTFSGPAEATPVIFVHGFGCDQSMWREVTRRFERSHRMVTYDLTGMGQSDLSAYDPGRYANLQAHAEDLLAIIDELGFEKVALVGHSVGATIALLAANQAPERISRLVLVAPSPCFMEDEARDYHGGFSRDELEGLIAFLDENHLGWSAHMAPTIAGQPEGAAVTEELTQSFCRTDPTIAQHFGRVTFLGDERRAFEQAARPCLILHCNEDVLVPMAVADWMKDEMPNATLKILEATGHCPHMTVPDEVAAAMRLYLGNS
jgi:sigma-B regulation protein RsbQ